MADDADVRALVLARIWQGRLVRAADGLYDAATQAAKQCQRHVDQDPKGTEAAEWADRANHWRNVASRALDLVREWE